jgi:hypothetical protein
VLHVLHGSAGCGRDGEKDGLATSPAAAILQRTRPINGLQFTQKANVYHHDAHTS